jgi:hypothetical protein
MINPSLVSVSDVGSQVSVTEQTLSKLECPACKVDLDVTGLGLGMKVMCSNCDNWTYIPGRQASLWRRLKKQILNSIPGIFVGIIVLVFGTLILEQISEQISDKSSSLEPSDKKKVSKEMSP